MLMGFGTGGCRLISGLLSATVAVDISILCFPARRANVWPFYFLGKLFHAVARFRVTAMRFRRGAGFGRGFFGV